MSIRLCGAKVMILAQFSTIMTIKNTFFILKGFIGSENKSQFFLRLKGQKRKKHYLCRQ